MTDVQIGSDQKVVSEFYQPLNAPAPGSWRPACASRHGICRSIPTTWRSPIIAIARRKAISTSAARSATGAKSASAITAPTARCTCDYGDPTLVQPQYNNGEFFFKFSYDRLDNVHFPRDGQTFSVQWDANRVDLGGDSAFDKVQADWLMARSDGRNTILLWTTAGVTDGNINSTALPDFYSLGGFFNLSGLAPQSLLGPNYAITRAIYFRRISRGGEGLFEFPAYIGMSLELGNTWQHAQRYECRFGPQGRVGVPGVRHVPGPAVPGLRLRHRRLQRLFLIPRPNLLIR